MLSKEQTYRIRNKTRDLILLTFLLAYFQNYNAQEADTSIFRPKIEIFDGYLTMVQFKVKLHQKNNRKEYYQFFVFSKDSLTKVNFKFKKAECKRSSNIFKKNEGNLMTENSDDFYLKDTNLILIFYGGRYPLSMKEHFHQLSRKTYFARLPEFSSIKEINKWKYSIISIRVRFEAFDYQQYKPFIGKNDYSNIADWFVFGGIIVPEIVTSNNKFYIVNYFY